MGGEEEKQANNDKGKQQNANKKPFAGLAAEEIKKNPLQFMKESIGASAGSETQNATPIPTPDHKLPE